jgi:cephalosporin hydroxylase
MEEEVTEDAYKAGEELEEKLKTKWCNGIECVDDFHKLYERNRIWEKNTWLGIPCWKLPMDAFVIQELIFKTRPTYIIETGTGHGGSALFYASICELIGHGRVASIDNDSEKFNSTLNKWGNLKCADRITFFKGDSVEIAQTIKQMDQIKDNNCMVILDSWHTMEHVYNEMLVYSELVKSGGYMIVEDSHAAGNPVPWEYDDYGPMGAITKWLHLYGDEWEADYSCHKHKVTFNPRGYLIRK